LVSVPALAEEFFQGIDKVLVGLFANPGKAKVTKKQLLGFLQKLPY
jgi:hypothetical protein